MRAPANKRNTDEIVTEIIKRAKCPPEAAPLVQRIIQRLISDLRAAPEPFSGNQKENVEFAEKFRTQIIELEDTLKSASDNPFVLSVLFEERFWQLWWDEQNTAMPIQSDILHKSGHIRAALLKNSTGFMLSATRSLVESPENTAAQNTSTGMLHGPALSSWKMSPGIPRRNYD